MLHWVGELGSLSTYHTVFWKNLLHKAEEVWEGELCLVPSWWQSREQDSGGESGAGQWRGVRGRSDSCS